MFLWLVNRPCAETKRKKHIEKESLLFFSQFEQMTSSDKKASNSIQWKRERKNIVRFCCDCLFRLKPFSVLSNREICFWVGWVIRIFFRYSQTNLEILQIKCNNEPNTSETVSAFNTEFVRNIFTLVCFFAIDWTKQKTVVVFVIVNRNRMHNAANWILSCAVVSVPFATNFISACLDRLSQHQQNGGSEQ